MSTWTHVNAAIRLYGNSILSLGEPAFSDIYSPTALALRKQVSDYRGTDFSICPSGSEGSLKYNVFIEEDFHNSPSIMIWGDLRDFNDTPQLLRYFDKVVEGKDVRSGVLEIEVNEIVSIYRYQYAKGWMQV